MPGRETRRKGISPPQEAIWEFSKWKANDTKQSYEFITAKVKKINMLSMEYP